MTITKGEFTHFTINGRLQLLQLYGCPVFRIRLKQHYIIIYKIFNFYVATIITKTTNQLNHTVHTAEPVTPGMMRYYRSLQDR